MPMSYEKMLVVWLPRGHAHAENIHQSCKPGRKFICHDNNVIWELTNKESSKYLRVWETYQQNDKLIKDEVTLECKYCKRVSIQLLACLHLKEKEMGEGQTKIHTARPRYLLQESPPVPLWCTRGNWSEMLRWSMATKVQWYLGLRT